MAPPRVSIVCTALDGERHLPTLRSALDGTLTDDCELVLMDDGSTDGTGASFDAWRDELPRVTVLHNRTPLGQSRAQSAAIARATGEYVWLIDCDDRFPASAVTDLLDAATRHDADVVVGTAHSIDADGVFERRVDAHDEPRTLDRQEAVLALLDGSIEGYTWTKLYRRSLLLDAEHADGATPPPLTTQCDFTLAATAIARSRTVRLIDDVVYYYVRHGSSQMDRKDPPLENLAIARDHLARIARRELPDEPGTRRAIARFTTWFVAASAIQIPFYVRASAATKARGRRLARRAIRGVRPIDVMRLDRTLGMEALLLRLSPALYELVFRLTHRRSAG